MSGEQWGEAVDAAIAAGHEAACERYYLTRSPYDQAEVAMRAAINAAAPLIVADTRRKVAEEIALAIEAEPDLEHSCCDCPGDQKHHAAIARGSGNGDSGQEGT